MGRFATSRRSVLTIGNFDGVHLGHAALVEAARLHATRWRGSPSRGGFADSPSRPESGTHREPGTPNDSGSESRRNTHGSESRATSQQDKLVALCFDPHPLSVLRPGTEPPLLTTFEQRREYLMTLGVDAVEPLRPTREFLAQSAGQFIDWLVQKYQPSAIVEGPDFRFGKGRAGSIETLQNAGSRLGFDTIVVEPVEVTLANQLTARASSSLVRWLITHGRVRDARLVLGRPYELRGKVTRGEQRGRSIGVPTANLEVDGQLLPADGIYAGHATAPNGSKYQAAISIGTKPTFGEHPRLCEAHLLDYHGAMDEYGWCMRVECHDWLRDQVAFDDVQPLIAQIQRDLAATRRIVSRDWSPGSTIAHALSTDAS